MCEVISKDGEVLGNGFYYKKWYKRSIVFFILCIDLLAGRFVNFLPNNVVPFEKAYIVTAL